MSDRVTWETCPRCGQRAAVGWTSRAGVPGAPPTEELEEYDCLSGCRVDPELLRDVFGDGVGDIRLERQRDGVLALHLRGEVDGAAVQRFEGNSGSRPVAVAVIDAGDVTFISSAGIRLLLTWASAAQAAGVTPVLRRSSDVVERLLRIAQLDDLFSRP